MSKSNNDSKAWVLGGLSFACLLIVVLHYLHGDWILADIIRLGSVKP
jgi:hypothetical protein